jgi:hypothetical protein
MRKSLLANTRSSVLMIAPKMITEQTISLLSPGETVTMAMIISRYSESPKNVCPRPGYHSHCIIRSHAGGMIW